MSIKIKTGHARIKMPDGTYQDLSGFSMGASDVPEKEWVLKGTITTAEKDTGVNVDLSGCSELAILGSTEATGTVSLYARINGSVNGLINGVSASGSRSLIAMFNDTAFGYFGTGKYTSTPNANAYNIALNCYAVSRGSKIEEITRIYFSAPGTITDCNLSIYAR